MASPDYHTDFGRSLSNQKNDEELEEAVTVIFGQYGSCHVKIRRDKNKMPFAFVIYQVQRESS